MLFKFFEMVIGEVRSKLKARSDRYAEASNGGKISASSFHWRTMLHPAFPRHPKMCQDLKSPFHHTQLVY